MQPMQRCVIMFTPDSLFRARAKRKTKRKKGKKEKATNISVDGLY